MDWNDASLEFVGLRDIEKAVLKTLSTAKNVKEIVESVKFSRTGVVYTLDELVKKGLVTVSKQQKRTFYIALAPDQFKNKLHTAIDSISQGKKGVRLRTPSQDEFIIHYGLNEIIPTYNRIASMSKNERIRGIQHHRSYDKLLEKVTPKQLIEFNDTVRKNHLIMDGLLNESAYTSYWDEIKKEPKKYVEAVKSLMDRMADYSVYPDNLFNYDAELWIFKNTTMIINWEEEIAVEMRSPNITGFFRDAFESVKKTTRKIDHNEAMRKLMEKTNVGK